MRQPEVASLARLLLALVLLLPLLDAGRSMVVAGAFLAEFLGHASRPLSRLTTEPVRTAMAVPHAAVDRYTRPGARAVPLVLVHGLTPDGKDDARLAAAASLLARAGFDVAVPTVPGLTRVRLRPADRDPVIATIRARPEPTVVVGVSVGAGIAMLAAAEPAVRDRVPLIVSLGGYASAVDLVRYYLTSALDPALVQSFVDANADLLDASARRVLRARDAASVAAALGALSPDLARLLDALSPVRVLADLRGELILVHGRADLAVPYTQSLALHARRPARSRLVLVGVVDHVEPTATIAITGTLRDIWALWTVVYALVARA